MQRTPNRPLPVVTRAVTVAAVCAVGAGLAAAMTSMSADAGTRCTTQVTHLKAVSKQRFAGDGVMQRYRASVDYPGAGGWVDQTANALFSRFPAGVTPTLLNSRLGERATTGDMVKNQHASAVAAINGDFFVTPSIRGREVELARGPMVRDGRVLRADRQRDKVVGVDASGEPFDGTLGVRGKVQSGTSPEIPLAAVNWERVQADGVTLYTANWSASSSSPRPAGAAEWVIDGRNRIVEVRTSTRNSGRLGDPVAGGTRVLAFPDSYSLVAASGTRDARVQVRVRQKTSTGVVLETAIGRGMTLVDGGVAAPLGCSAYDHSKAARPRTVIGWTKSGRWRTMTIPGTKFVGVGLRVGGLGLANEAALAKRLGMDNAYELDGGGSTTLYTRSAAGKWTRRDLYRVTGGSYERPVTNGIAFVKTAP